MLGWLLWGIIVGGAVAAIIIITVSFLDEKKAQEELREKNIKKATVKDIVKDSGVTHIKLDGLDDEGNTVEVQFDTDSFDSSEIRRGTVIYT